MDTIDWLMLAGVVLLLIAAGWLFIQAGVTYEPPEEPVLGVGGIDRAPMPHWHNHGAPYGPPYRNDLIDGPRTTYL